MIAAVLLAGLLAAATQPGAAAAGPPAPPAPVHDDAWLEAALPAASGTGAPPADAWLRRAAALAVDALPGALALRRPLP
ncbi:MAG: response regulator, partial [Anaeromyxobacteraceae bacterium]|nr:response regulator [Anaeromyxobacteraceae bacterium]